MRPAGGDHTNPAEGRRSLVTRVSAAAGLILVERIGKAIRSPARDTLLAHAGTSLGRGRAFAVHEILDQAGAFAGPLLIAAVLAATGSFSAGFAALAVPGLAALVLVAWLARRVPDPVCYEHTEPVAAGPGLPWSGCRRCPGATSPSPL